MKEILQINLFCWSWKSQPCEKNEDKNDEQSKWQPFIQTLPLQIIPNWVMQSTCKEEKQAMLDVLNGEGIAINAEVRLLFVSSDNRPDCEYKQQ